ncbi:EAL domain-containing protein [Pseudoalteromonas denitrificans]|uniref:EAL domain, c-di-GMP-specific phosphodiesterase class I (Or its enzymatically inactive variant) n=1 Tax=Pseudoalteromonas denitrificans DSM 6059 TaxID=1123010 RepID=A0A1I1GMX6_9GAMM|nr:EAL domain-containing protein [Pseudoalteromonas denitrificans]SFC13109.1 EAL domain, c-di-GMP-specific phosphodiesterase class I (or its enzymatically inactive variant) [Pseudoalteromonas denitrificans DSM 6059]
MPNTHTDNSFVKMPIISTEKENILGYEILLRTFRGIPLSIFNRNPELFTELSFPMLEAIYKLDAAGKIRDSKQLLFLNLTVHQYLSKGTLDFLYQEYNHKDKAKNVVIELTEQELDYKTEQLKERTLIFKCLDFKLAIDDFGVKGSNFQRVFELSPHYIKLDRGIIARYNSSQVNHKVLIEFVKLCHTLNKKVIIEGIETKQQYQLAKTCQADYVQGFYFGLPQYI